MANRKGSVLAQKTNAQLIGNESTFLLDPNEALPVDQNKRVLVSELDTRYGLKRNAQGTTVDATATAIATYAVPTNSVVLIRAKIIGKRTGGIAGAAGDSATFVVTARFKNVAGVVTIHDLQSNFVSRDQIAWIGVLDVLTTNARVVVTGAANNNISWTTVYEIEAL